MTKMTPSISISFISSDLYKIYKALYALKQNIRANVDSLLYSVTLQMDVGVGLRAENYKYFCLSDTLISVNS